MEPKKSVLFLGLKSMSSSLPSASDIKPTVITEDNVKNGIRAMDDHRPQMVIVSSTLNQEIHGGILSLIRIRFLAYRPQAMIVDDKQLTIHQWNPEEKTFVTRTSTLDQMSDEIESSFEPSMETMSAEALDKLKKLKEIGFYDCIKHQEQQFHVQTEIIWSDKIKIKASVIESGAIRESAIHLYPLRLTDIEEGTAYIKDIHQRLVDKIKVSKP